MENKTIGIILAVMVSVLLVGGLLVPIVNDATADADTFTNAGIFYVDELGTDESIHYVFEDGVLTVNDVAIDLDDIYSNYEGGASILFTEKIILRYTSGADVVAIRGITKQNVIGFDLTVSNGTITGTKTGETGTDTDVSWTYTEFTGIVPSSNTVMANFPVYLNGDTEINVTGFVSASNIGGYYVANVSGSIQGGFSVSLFNQNTGESIADVTVNNISVNNQTVDNYVDLYVLESITFDITNGTSTDNVTFSLMVVPEKVTADRTDPMDPAAAGVLSTAPILIIVALLAMVAAVLIRTRY